jgi:hypothetical protein
MQAGEQEDVGFLGHQAQDLVSGLLPEEMDPPFHAQPTGGLSQAVLIPSLAADEEVPSGRPSDRADRQRDALEG